MVARCDELRAGSNALLPLLAILKRVRQAQPPVLK
jgi:hypothetical protein